MNSSKLADSNIPQGRGMIKWMPFATMPEQFENVSNLIEAQLHVPKPNLTVELQQELELKLRELQGCNVILRYWSDSYEFQVECTIEHVDDWSRMVTVNRDAELLFIQFENIYEVSKYNYLENID